MALALPPDLKADTLKLKSGTSLEGMVVSEDDTRVVFKDASQMVLTFKRDQIDSVTKGGSSIVAEDQGDKAIAAGDLEKGLASYEEALASKGDAARLQPKIDRVRKMIATRDLGDFADDLEGTAALIEQKRIQDAERELAKIAKAAGENPKVQKAVCDQQTRAAIVRARAYADSVRYNEANVELRRALALSPQDATIHIELANLMARSIRTQPEAVESYKKALELGDKTLTQGQKLDTNLKIADIHRSNSQFEAAARHYKIVFDANPNYRRDLTDVLIASLIKMASQVTDKKAAVVSLRQAVAVRPNNVEVQESLARLLLDLQEYDGAIAEFTRLLEISPGRKEANYNLAQAYLGKLDPVNAKTHLEREVALAPRSYLVLCDLGDVYWRLGDYDEAQATFKKAQEVNPNDPRALVALARAERRLGRLADARHSIQEILKRFPSDVRATLELGLVYLDEKNYDEAPKFLSSTLEMLEQQTALAATREGKTLKADALLARGEIALLTTGPATATKDFNKALEVYPDYPAAHFSIATAYQKKFNSSKAIDDLKEAEKEMLKARELEPRNPEFAYGLGVFYHRVLAAEDKENSAKYIGEAVKQYKEYLSYGGAQATEVSAWITELGGSS